MAYDADLAARIRRQQAQLLVGIIGVVFFGGFGAITLSEIRDVEAGVRESTDVWLPAAYLYRLFGLWGAAAAFGVMMALGAGLFVGALRQRRRLTATVDRAALHRTRRAMEAGTPRFVRGTDAGGRLRRESRSYPDRGPQPPGRARRHPILTADGRDQGGSPLRPRILTIRQAGSSALTSAPGPGTVTKHR